MIYHICKINHNSLCNTDTQAEFTTQKKRGDHVSCIIDYLNICLTLIL